MDDDRSILRSARGALVSVVRGLATGTVGTAFELGQTVILLVIALIACFPALAAALVVGGVVGTMASFVMGDAGAVPGFLVGVAVFLGIMWVVLVRAFRTVGRRVEEVGSDVVHQVARTFEEDDEAAARSRQGRD